MKLFTRSIGIVALYGLATAAPAAATLVTSSTFDGNVAATVAAFAAAGASAPSGSLLVSGVPVGSTILSATLYADNYFQSVTPSAVFGATNLGSVSAFATSGDASNYKWNVTGLVTGSGSFSASASGLTNNYGLALVVVFSNPSLPVGHVVVNDGAQDFINNAGIGAVNSTAFNASAGPAAVWIHTGADNTIQSNETISLNGTVIGGPIDENIGGFASLFQLFGTAVNGLNTVTINSSQGDVFDWDIAVLQTSPGPSAAPEPGTLLLLGPGLVALGRLAWRRHRS
ncbi:MAG: hypothetical protein DMD96_15725 [Candidatus Rokuibacteriota bacterium]|nr:MAG: hypothetical protein DMD96_15725 [Candidatus Rokubacteria bacterium]